MFTIFISHSTLSSDDDGLQRLTDLSAALRAAPPPGLKAPDVLLDKERLKGGDDWRNELNDWMARSHAGIVLLTPRALESSWVLKEATILSHRKAVDPSFELFPVLLDGVEGRQLSAADSRFSAVYLDLIHRVPATEPAAIAEEVLKLLAPRLKKPPETPAGKLERKLAAALTKGAVSEYLEDVCEKVTGKSVAFTDAGTRAQHCASAMARALVVGELGTYADIAELIQDLVNAGLPKEPCVTVLHALAPHWVNPFSAVPLGDLAHRNLKIEVGASGAPMSLASVIDGTRMSFTADMYVRRAYAPDSRTLIKIVGGQSDIGIEELTAAIRSEVGKEDMLADSETDDFLAKLSYPYFVLLPPPLPDEHLLEELRKAFPRLTFIVATEDVARDRIPSGAVALLPGVDKDREQSAFAAFKNARDLIKREFQPLD